MESWRHDSVWGVTYRVCRGLRGKAASVARWSLVNGSGGRNMSSRRHLHRPRRVSLTPATKWSDKILGGDTDTNTTRLITWITLQISTTGDAIIMCTPNHKWIYVHVVEKKTLNKHRLHQWNRHSSMHPKGPKWCCKSDARHPRGRRREDLWPPLLFFKSLSTRNKRWPEGDRKKNIQWSPAGATFSEHSCGGHDQH